MPRDPASSQGEAGRPRGGWRWSDDILNYRVKFVAWTAVVALIALAGYLLLDR